MTMGLFLLIVGAVLLALMLLSGWYVRAISNTFVRRKLTDIETIFETGEPPAAWHWRADPAITGRDIRRLDKLRRYLVKTSLVVDEQTREEVSQKLTETRALWLSRLRH